MKNLKTILLVVMSLVAFIACTDKEPEVPDVPDVPEVPVEPETPEVVQKGIDYLVMFYSVGGRDLDASILANIYQALDAGSSDNVKMTVQFKSSARQQDWYPEFDGTRRLDLDDNKHFVGTMKSAVNKYPFITQVKELTNLFEKVKSERFADSSYDMTTSDALADFITWSMKQHPDAKRTVLILNDHGNGWRLTDDGQQGTRAILQDDNTNTLMSLGSVVEGVKKSAGKVDLIYTDACLMSMYENLYGYANCANYLLAAVEITPGAGGNYTKLLTDLKTAGTSNAELEATMHDFTDYLVSDKWWKSESMITTGYGGKYHDIALYDLSKLDKLTPVLKKVVDTMAEKFSSDESVEPTAEEVPLGEKFHGYINDALINCQVAYVSIGIPTVDVPGVLLPYITADEVKMSLKLSDAYDTDSLVHWMKYAETENARNAHEAYPYDWTRLHNIIIQLCSQSFPITDILRLIDKTLTEAGAKNNPFTQLKAELLAALKEVGYISCTISDDKPGIDQAYELCSPGITIVPFNDSYYDKETNIFIGDIPTPQDAFSIYQQTDFDQQVGWSRILQLIEVFPDVFSNPSRDRVGKE